MRESGTMTLDERKTFHPNKMIKLGLCIPSRKKSRIRLPERIEDLCIKANIKVIEIDINKNLESQGPFDVLLHKIVDYFNIYSQSDAQEKINKLINYASKHKQMKVIDDFSLCLKITKRNYIVELLKSCKFTLNGIKVFTPKTLFIDSPVEPLEISEQIRNDNMKFPVLRKPSSACLDQSSHNMALIFNHEGVTDITSPCLLQEFCNHEGVYYKVFVVGSKFHICENPSIKNIDASYNNRPTMFFNARNISKIGQPFQPRLHENDPNLRKWLTCDEKPNMLDTDVIEEIIERLQDISGCSLFKFDVLIESETGNYALIDFNQFPSYEGINEKYFPEHLVEHIILITGNQ